MRPIRERSTVLRGGTRIAALAAAVLFLSALAGPVAALGLFESDPIFDYARNGDTGAVEYFLKKGANIDTSNPAGETVLIIGTQIGNLEMVNLALGRGARVDREDKFGKTALCWAAERGEVPIVERLLAAHADVNRQTQEGLTPVMFAVRSNRLAVLRVLLKGKVDLSLLDYTGRSALGWARASRDRRAETMLVRAGAKD
jgi:uncharacterized protein